MNIFYFIILLFVLQILYWIVGRRASTNLNTKDDYFLAGKSVRLFPLMMTFLATQVGGGLVLGAADEAYQFGWPVLLYPIGAGLGLILLGLGIGSRLAQFQVSTVAQILEVVYRSAMLRKFASILSVLSLFMILVAQIIASNKFLGSIGFNNDILFVIFWGIVIIYTAQGGLKAVISTDLVQAAFFSVVFLFCFGFVLYTYPNTAVDLPSVENFTSVSTKLCGWLLMPLLFIVIGQDMGQRCFAGSSPKIVSKACLFAGIGTMVVCVVPVYFGTLAKNMGLNIPKGTSVLIAVIEQTTNPWVAPFVGCAIIAAIISTATSLINAISSNLSNDFKVSFFQKSDAVKIIQRVTCVISVAAIFFAFYFDNIVDLLIQSYELSVSCLFVPIFIALFKKRGEFLAALLAILFGILGFFIFRIYPIEFPREIASIFLSLLGFCMGEVIAMYSNKNACLTAEVVIYEEAK